MSDQITGPVFEQGPESLLRPGESFALPAQANITTLKILQATPGLSDAAVNAAARWWEQTSPDQPLALFLLDQGVFRADAPPRIEKVTAGELAVEKPSAYFTLYGLDSLRRCLSRRSAMALQPGRRSAPAQRMDTHRTETHAPKTQSLDMDTAEMLALHQPQPRRVEPLRMRPRPVAPPRSSMPAPPPPPPRHRASESVSLAGHVNPALEMSYHNAAEELEPGDRLGKCLITGELGRGAHSVVFRALHRTLNVQVALKALLPPHSSDPDTLRLFAREARILARLNHPAIVRVLDFEPDPPHPHLVLECVDGLSLKGVLAHTGALRPLAVLRILREVAHGLAHANALGVIHRDIKPGNLLLDDQGRTKVADLGLARVTGHGEPGSQGIAGDSAGTPGYISPEEVLGLELVDFRSDVYSLGATAYHAITGRMAFEHADQAELMKMHVRQRLVPPAELHPEIPEMLSDLIVRMMAKQPPDRHASYDELLEDIRTVAAHIGAAEAADKKGRRGIGRLFGA